MPDTYELASSDGDCFLWQGNYVQISGNRWVLGGFATFALNPIGIYARLYGRAGWNPNSPTPYSDFGLMSARTRYNRIPGVAGGQYIRWANMQWRRQ